MEKEEANFSLAERLKATEDLNLTEVLTDENKKSYAGGNRY